MAKRAPKNPAPEPVSEPQEPGPDFSMVLPLSLLAGGLAAYPSLSAMADGEGDFMGAVTLFLGATLVATVGFAVVAWLFHLWSTGSAPAEGDETDGPEAAATDRSVRSDGRPHDGPVPTVALNPPPDTRADAIDTALAPTDALLHE